MYIKLIKMIFLKTILIITISQKISSSYQPVIGILTHAMPYNIEPAQNSFILTNYVRWLEAAGAKVIPIHQWFTDEHLEEVLGKVNGVVFAGGALTLKPEGEYERLAKKIFDKTIDLKKNHNTILPILGICQGLQLIHVFLMGANDLGSFSQHNIKGPMTIDQSIDSRLFSLLTKEEKTQIRLIDSVANFNNFGISHQHYQKYPELKDFFNPIALAYDTIGNVNYAAVEAFDYPIYAVQFHPEKPSYDKVAEDSIPQNPVAVKLSQSIGNFFVDQARLNKNRLTEEELIKYEYINTYTQLPSTYQHTRGIFYMYKYSKNK
jgi:gamma-glutamyl hydrolase